MTQGPVGALGQACGRRGSGSRTRCARARSTCGELSTTTGTGYASAPVEVKLTTNCVAMASAGRQAAAGGVETRSARVQVHVEVAGDSYESLVWEYLRVCASG